MIKYPSNLNVISMIRVDDLTKWLANQATIKGLLVQVIARIMKASDEEVQSIIIS